MANNLPYRQIEGLFTPEECASIISCWSSPEPGQVIGFKEPPPEFRISDLSWIRPDEKTAWIFERLQQVVLKKDELGITSSLVFSEQGLQLTRYEAAKGGHYYFHKDSNPLNRRRLSLSVLLNAPSSFEGGRMEFLDGDRKVMAANMDQGSVVYFDSSQVHRVSPVLKNVRWSLVAWYSEMSN